MLGVTRTYQTRHGAGPLPTEDAGVLVRFPERHNGYGEYQGGWRAGHLDTVLLRYAVAACGGVDGLAVTHLDARDLKAATSYAGITEVRSRTEVPGGVRPARRDDGTPTWTPLDSVPPLAFDHNRIVADRRSLPADKLWRDTAFTAGLLGPEFTTAQALDVTESLTGDRPYPANLGRTMDRVPGLERTAQHAAALPKGGRPPLVWRWSS